MWDVASHVLRWPQAQSYSPANITDESTISPRGQRFFSIALSSTPFLSPSLLVPRLAHYNSLTHYHPLHLTCSLWDFHIQQRSMGLFLIVRLTPFTSRSIQSLSLSLLIILCPSCYRPDLLLQSVSAPVSPPDTFCGNQYAYVLVCII